MLREFRVLFVGNGSDESSSRDTKRMRKLYGILCGIFSLNLPENKVTFYLMMWNTWAQCALINEKSAVRSSAPVASVVVKHLHTTRLKDAGRWERRKRRTLAVWLE